MIDDHDSSTEADQDTIGYRNPLRSPRFARLVQSPVARRLSPKRLILATVVGGGLILGGCIAGFKVATAIAWWVGAQPEHQIAFETVELCPSPPPYIPSGRVGILDSVRHAAKYTSNLSVLNTGLEAFRVDLSKNPWIERAGPVRATYRHLAIEVVYRKPLAVVVFDPNQNEASVIDRYAVELPIENKQFELVEAKQQYQVIGDTKCLIQIRGVGYPQPFRKGMTWKSADPKINDEVLLHAAELAQFLYDRVGSRTPLNRSMPDFRVIHYINQPVRNPQGVVEDVQGYFLRDSDGRYVFWHSAPNREAKDEPSTTEKWRMLARFIDQHGPLAKNLQEIDYLKFGIKGAEIARIKSTHSTTRSRSQGRS